MVGPGRLGGVVGRGSGRGMDDEVGVEDGGHDELLERHGSRESEVE